MSMNLGPEPFKRYFDSSGDPLSGGLLYSYTAGTTTPQNTYTDINGGTPNANPIVLDANGYAGSVWLDPTLSYKFVLKTSAGVTISTEDNIVGLLNTDSVPNSAIQDLAVTTAKLAANAVTTAKILDANVTTAKILDANVTLAKMANLAANSILGNNTGSPATPIALTATQTRAALAITPAVTTYTSGSGTFTTAANCTRLEVIVVGGGGGGGGGGTGGQTVGGAGTASTFGSSLLTANGGAAGGINGAAGAAGGTYTVNSPAIDWGSCIGGPGSGNAQAGVNSAGGVGGGSMFGSGGGAQAAGAGGAPSTNSGGGGAGGGLSAGGGNGGSGGGAGATVWAMIYGPSATYAYAVGGGGSAGGAGTSGSAGSAGAAGKIIVRAFFD